MSFPKKKEEKEILEAIPISLFFLRELYFRHYADATSAQGTHPNSLRAFFLLSSMSLTPYYLAIKREIWCKTHFRPILNKFVFPKALQTVWLQNPSRKKSARHLEGVFVKRLENLTHTNWIVPVLPFIQKFRHFFFLYATLFPSCHPRAHRGTHIMVCMDE